VYARVTEKKNWIERNTNGTQDSNCHLELAVTEDPFMPSTNNNSDENPIIPVELIAGVSAAFCCNTGLGCLHLWNLLQEERQMW